MASPNWNTDRLKDIAKVNAESLGAGTADDYQFKYIEISNVDYYGIISKEAIKELEFSDAPSRARRCLKESDIIVSSVRPNLQAIAHIEEVAEQDLICSTGFNVVSPQHRVENRFLYYFLLAESTKQYFESVAKGVGYPAIDDKDFCSVDVPLPSFGEQELVARYLDICCVAINQAIDAKRKQLDTLETLKNSVIQKAVTQGLDSNAKMKDSNVEWLGPIPNHWQVKKLKRVFSDVDYGISESTKQEGKHAVLKMGNIVQGEIVFSKIEYVDEVANHLVLEKNDLLFNRTNSLDQVAKVGIFKGVQADNITYASYLVRLRTDKDNSPHYVNYLVNTEAFLGLARKMAIPSVQQANLNPTRYCRLEIPVPPLDEQEEISGFIEARVRQIADVEDKLNAQVQVLSEYRKSLIHECVTGKRRITEKDIREVQQHV